MASSADYPTKVGNSVTQNSSAGTSCILTVPTHNEGNFLFAQLTWGVDANIATPAGWTLMESQITAPGYACRTAIFGRYASASEPANYTFTCASSAENVGFMVSFKWVSEVYVMDDVDFDSGTDASPDMEALTAEFDGGLILAVFGAEGNVVAADAGGPATYTDVYSRGSGGAAPVCSSLSYKTTDAGAVAATTGALTGAANWYAYHVVIKGALTCNQPSTDFNWDLTNEVNEDSLYDGTYEQQPTQMIVHTVPWMPIDWASNSSEDLPQQVNVNIERLIQEADSTLTTRSYLSYTGGHAPSNPIKHADTGTAHPNPVYQDAELYDADHTDATRRPSWTFIPYFLNSQGFQIRYYVTRIVAEFTADDDGDDVELFTACLSTRFDTDDPTVPTNTDIELLHRGAGNTKLYAPDYPISAWHCKRGILKSINALLTEMRPTKSVPLFGIYEYQGGA